MAVNQSQVDNILATASSDDPEVKLQNLEQEVELMKKSIKKLLIDLRERLNESDNPLTVLAQGGEIVAGLSGDDAARIGELENRTTEDAARIEELEKKVEELLARPEREFFDDVEEKPRRRPQAPVPHEREYESGIPDQRHLPQVPEVDTTTPLPAQLSGKQAADGKLCLHKVYQLFNWTKTAITKYGHDRLDIMLDSYQSIGYITKEAADEVKEIARIMPASLGEEHEVGADEFVSELYILNQILDPDDTSLDRDMIAVMMERDTKKGPSRRPKLPKDEPGEEWAHLIDKI
ncbi:MAG: hypothetical protein D5R99_04720 [Methanocalculus sp. MSAO_Arc1]|uniref:FlaD/FlaE family flagellar protein n=1 Tax=Methanocalculus TaxID=71151 RepID=UPI000FF1DCB9|nr:MULTISPECIES: FlaD/FlaE family flagellar protein [unclassified Methanocalculus]MCP1661926.1 archaellum component FlaD/FlaE [Methanocalculus sp. AMF5]RQD80558.1 MAG: hypothetical protein D5R99_04720 [Methanocalculus sp. MSAO_Arc1]